MTNYAGPFNPSTLTVFGSEILFGASDGLGNLGLWETNGALAGTSELSVPGATGNSATNAVTSITVFGSEALFEEGQNVSLWVTNGTATGTSELSLAGVATSVVFDLNPDFTVLGSEVLFEYEDTSGKYNIWTTDGTSGGTSELSVAGASSFFGLLGQQGLGSTVALSPDFTAFGSEVLFMGDDASGHGGLWVTNGTAGGTSELSVAGTPDLFPLGLTNVPGPDYTVFGSEVLFAGADASGNATLWVTNGTGAGTSELSVAGASSSGLLEAVFQTGGRHVLYPDFTVFGSEVLFEGDDASANYNLWITDGTSGGTSELSVAGASSFGLLGQKGLEFFTQALFPNFTVFGSKALFTGNDASGNLGLWVTNGTAAGTSELFVGEATPGELTILGSKVLFEGVDLSGHNSLWVTDGTAAGTSELSIAGASQSGLSPGGLTILGSEALFAGTDSNGHRELWVTDGTAAGTSELSVAGLGTVGNLGPVLGSELFFSATDANGLNVTWVTNGTAAGTSELLLVEPPPTVTSVTPSQASGVLNAGQTITITVGLSGPVRVSGNTSALTLTLNDGGTAYYDAAASAALGDASKLVFDYTVGSSPHEHNVAELVVQGGNIGAATILNAAFNAPDFSGLVTAFPDLSVAVAPPATVTSVVASPSGPVEGIGTRITITVTMSGAVSVSGGTPTLTLNDGGTASYYAAATAALNDPTKLVFDYFVQAGDHHVGELAITGGSLGGATIVDANGNNPEFSGVITAFPGLSVTAEPPATLTSVVASPASGTESAGADITITLTMSGAVSVSGGTPTLSLNDGGTASYNAAATAALNDPTKLVFDYTVQATDRNVGALAVLGGSDNGATIVDANGNTPGFSGLVTTFQNLSVTNPPATVTSVVASPASGIEGLGANITFTVTMSKAVEVPAGTPTLTLNNGGLAYYDAAATAALNDPTKLVFDYTVKATDSSVFELTVQDGSLNGAPVRDIAGNTPDFSGLTTAFPNLEVAVPPTVIGVGASPSSGAEGVGDTIAFTVGMTKGVTVSGGIPTLTLNNGGLAYYNAAATAALNDPTRLVFDYTVQATDQHVGELAVQGDSFNGATILDALGNSADFSGLARTFPGLGVLAPSPATLTSVVASPASGTEGVGADITITVTMSAAVSVSGGTPTLTLNDGGTASYNAAATAALNDPTKLVFDYTVKASDNNVGELTVLSCSPNGATIVDANDFTVNFLGLTAAFPGLSVLATPPATVTSVVASPASGVEGLGAEITFTVTMSNIVEVPGGTPTLTLNNGGLAYYDAAATAALNDPTKLVFDYTVKATDSSVTELTVQDGSLNGAPVRDIAGNTPDFSGLATAFPNLAVAVPPTVVGVGASPSSGVEGVGASITFTVDMTKGVTVFGGTPTLTLNDGGQATYNAAATAALNDPTRLVFNYTVQATDHDVGALTVQGDSFNGATILDALGNSADFSGLATAFPNLSVAVDAPATVTSVVASPASGTEMPGQTITFTLTMSKAVTVSGGLPYLALNDGGFPTYDAAATTALNDPTKLVFDYTVAAYDETVSTLSIVGGGFGGATIVDAAGVVPDFSGSHVSFPALAVDPPPAVSAASSAIAAQPGIDLTAITFGTQTTFAYTPNQSNTGGSLSVSDGTHDASITLLGQYAAGDFRIASDAHGGTLVSDPKLSGAALTTFLASAHT